MPAVTITRTGLTLADDAALAALSEDFAARNAVRLPGFIDEPLLHHVQAQLRGENFVSRTHEGIGHELCLDCDAVTGLLEFLMNDKRLFEFVDRVTGCGSIRCFDGRMYRMEPVEAHYDSWHHDVGKGRLIAISINFSERPYEGGVLQLRKKDSVDIPLEVPNLVAGDAIMFRISPDLRHRVTGVVGSAAKTAYAGWFCSQPDYWQLWKEKFSSGSAGHV
jgi:hypothetical protein